MLAGKDWKDFQSCLFIKIDTTADNRHSETGLTTSECNVHGIIIGDGVCDDLVNTARCNFDQGDCCKTVSSAFTNCNKCICYGKFN
jgi:hypothetical protein